MSDSNLQTLPPFNPAVFHRRLALTLAVQRLLLTLILTGWAMSLIPRLINSYIPDAFILTGLAGWFLANYASSRTARLSLQSTQLSAVEAPTPQVEHILAQSIPGFTLYCNIRYMLTHQLAVLRHRQHRYHESAAIAVTLLEHLPPGPRSRHATLRVKLLILLADAAIFQQQLTAAYFALSELQYHTLDITQTMQVLEIQTRYQLACGRPRLALVRLPQKLQMIDLMPQPHAIQMHHLLALAAESDARPKTAAYLRRRRDLLTPSSPTPDGAASL